MKMKVKLRLAPSARRNGADLIEFVTPCHDAPVAEPYLQWALPGIEASLHAKSGYYHEWWDTSKLD